MTSHPHYKFCCFLKSYLYLSLPLQLKTGRIFLWFLVLGFITTTCEFQTCPQPLKPFLHKRLFALFSGCAISQEPDWLHLFSVKQTTKKKWDWNMWPSQKTWVCFLSFKILFFIFVSYFRGCVQSATAAQKPHGILCSLFKNGIYLACSFGLQISQIALEIWIVEPWNQNQKGLHLIKTWFFRLY